MAVTQYIGARYVPLFAEPLEWNSSQSYEPLTIVYHAGNSYTSRQFVPSGIEINNEAYWALTGNYNAQIEQYREEVKQYDARISQNASAITAEIARAKAAEQAEEQRATAAEATKAPINHASEETIYGVGDAVNYGHLKLAVDDTPMTSGANDGVAATPKMIADAILHAKNIRTIEDYGCNANIADNSEKLQSAINDCAKNGYILIVPKGTYTCASQVYIPWHTYMFGVGKQSVIKFTSDTGFVSPIDSNGYKISADVCIKHMRISGPNSDISKNYNEECAGIIGMFTSCEIEDLFIDHFEIGIKLNQNVKNPDYNNKYNHIFGDLRSWKNISIDSCNMGIKSNQWDTFFDTVAIASCWYSMLCGYDVSNLHIWGCHFGLFAEIGNFNNIEIESQLMNGDISESFIIINTNDNVTLNNVKLWNVINDDNISYSHPYIRGDDNHNGNVIINGLYIGADATDPAKLKKPIIRLNKLNAIVQGVISNTITELATGFGGAPKSTYSGSNGYAQGNLLANFALTGAIDISKTTGYKTVTTS